MQSLEILVNKMHQVKLIRQTGWGINVLLISKQMDMKQYYSVSLITLHVIQANTKQCIFAYTAIFCGTFSRDTD